MENLKEQGRVELSEYIKEVVLRHCPFSDNRIHLLGKAQAPVMDINISLKNDKTRISFLYGTHNFKVNTAESATCEYYIDFEDVESLMNFILNDHEIIKYLDTQVLDEIRLGFAINWTDKTLKGMNCSDINLKLDFYGNKELRDKFLYEIIRKYSSYLEHLEEYQQMREDELQNLKKRNLVSMSKQDMIDYLSTMSEEDLRLLLLYANNAILVKYFNHEKEKELIL